MRDGSEGSLAYKRETDFSHLPPRPPLRLNMIGEEQLNQLPVTRRLAERMIGGEVFGSQVLRALEKHDQFRKRPETTTAREIVRTELRHFKMRCERLDLRPDAGEVRGCVWTSAALAIGFAAGVLFAWGIK